METRNASGIDGNASEIKTSDAKPEKSAAPGKGVIDTMTAAGNFTTLVAGIKAAGLTDRLSGSGSYTVFAPTDEAFKKLAPGALDALLKDSAKLKAVLHYHVVSGHLEAKHVKAGDLVTLQGSTLKVESSNQDLRVNEARVTQLDMIASNGVVHAIDTVILPASWKLLAAAA
jgi:uncharacterized surface protein with fasciclin (FAS1) repeats